jgi:hypothetical protein
LEKEMASRKSNVHPDYYKTRGREPVGQEALHQTEKAAYTRMRSRARTRNKENLIPVQLEKKVKVRRGSKSLVHREAVKISSGE